MAEVSPHPEGLLYFELFWDQAAADNAVHLVEGEIHGAGPWKAGECVITLLGCHGSHPEQAAEYAAWQLHLEELGERYPTQRQIEKMARERDALV